MQPYGFARPAWTSTPPNNLIGYLREQTAATGALPTDRTIVFERFRDELGDWRVCVHCAPGSSVLAPWALAIEHSARERYGMEVQATATNDGIVLRIPDTESDPPNAELIICDTELHRRRVVTDEVAGSALFAARFREAPPAPCCCRGGIRSPGHLCGSSGCARPSCSPSPPSIRSSQSCWRPCGSA